MSSTWIGTPVENAKEVVERYLNKLFTDDGLPPGNYIKENCTVSYDSNCEVYLTSIDIFNNIRPEDGFVYFGMMYVNIDNSLENNLVMGLDTGGDTQYTLDCGTNGIQTSAFPLMFNSVVITPNHANQFFIGYKFTIINP